MEDRFEKFLEEVYELSDRDFLRVLSKFCSDNQEVDESVIFEQSDEKEIDTRFDKPSDFSALLTYYDSDDDLYMINKRGYICSMSWNEARDLFEEYAEKIYECEIAWKNIVKID